MKYDPFYEAAIPEPVRLLGQDLRPLSIGHLMLLKRIGSPFVCPGDGPILIGDLAVAVFICCQTYEEGLDAIRGGDIAKTMARWGKQLKNVKGDELQRRFEMFREYMDAAFVSPSYSVSSRVKGGSVNMPLEQVIKCVLLMKTTLTESEILNRPFSLCQWDYVTLCAIEGNIEVLMPEDADNIRAALSKFMPEKGNNGA